MHVEKQLTRETLAAYRQRLTELEQIRRQTEIPLSQPLSSILWQVYDPQCPTGRQIYGSYTDAELLDFILETMDHPGHKPQWEQIFYIYQVYIKKRFGNKHTATQKARGRRKLLVDQKRWPPDWPEHVSPDGVTVLFSVRGRPLISREEEILRNFCCSVREKRSPPQEEGIPDEIKRLFRTRGYLWQKGLELMGIPVLNKLALKHLKSYWRQSWEKEAAAGQGGTAPSS